MGVPALFRWLSQKYPKIISPVTEERPQDIDGEEIPVDTTKPNPNGEEMDNLYLDMNGIVHPCSHPEDRPPPATEGEMMLEIFKYTDRVVNMVRPRKLLMIAVDGVAPRAKMNQQRSRRFRSAKEAKEKDEEKAEFVKMLRSQNGGVLEETTSEGLSKKTWDSNAITPGTPFMQTLAVSLRYWCSYKLNTDPAWEKLKVIISDATVPGEGEHKIMEFIRSQRRSPEHDPNTRHVIYGLDADLIMLGLATHEPHFRVLREDVFAQDSKPRTCNLCGQPGHKADECRGEAKKKQGEFDEKQGASPLKPFIWLHVSVLREYLEAELYVPQQPFKFDLERALDDWVFMCFFVGNDFLPHLPSLDIREAGIDTLIAIWRDNVPVMGGYVTKDGHVNLERAQLILSGLAKQEGEIFKRRKETEERKEASAKRRRLDKGNRNGYRYSGAGNDGRNDMQNGAAETPVPRDRRPGKKTLDTANPSAPPTNIRLFKPGQGPLQSGRSVGAPLAVVTQESIDQTNVANKSAAAVLKERLLSQRVVASNDAVLVESARTEVEREAPAAVNGEAVGGETLDSSPSSILGKRKAEALEKDESSTPGRQSPDPADAPRPEPEEQSEDTIRLWEEGYADRYYEQKFGVDPKDISFRNKVARSYVEGLAWVLLYYFQGCPSWTWYYPYHYAPFAADFVDLDKMKISFDKGTPFRPYEQLMGVLPAASNHAIPEVFRSLMSEADSDILDFYPEEFPIDLNGKKFAWQGVALLPFIDAPRLLAAMATKYPLLSADEKARNEVGKDVLLFSDRHPLFDEVALNFYSKKAGAPKYKLDPRISEGLSGKVEKNEAYLPQTSLVFPLAEGGMPDLDDDHSISVYYEMPHSTHVHKSMLLRGVHFPPPVLDHADIATTKSRATRTGRAFGGVPFQNGNGGGYGNGNGRRENGYSRGELRSGFSYASGAPDARAQQQDARPNPFAAHLNPAFFPSGVQNGMKPFPPPPPPAHAASWGAGMGPPPPPQQGAQQQQQGAQQQQQGAQQQQYGYGYGGGYEGQMRRQGYSSGGYGQGQGQGQGQYDGRYSRGGGGYGGGGHGEQYGGGR